jgi:hypothetical protein
MDDQQQREIRETYRALLARGLEPGEAANLTAFLHGLPSENLHWSVREVEALVVRRRAWSEAASAADALEAVTSLKAKASADGT